MKEQAIIDRAFASARYVSVPLENVARPTMENGRLRVSSELLTELSKEAFKKIAFFLRRSQLEGFASVFLDPESSENDRFVVKSLLRNAVISARGELPLCQDTGTAAVVAWKSESTMTGCEEAAALSEGARIAYGTYNLRSSQVGASSFFEEYDTLTNLPAQVHVEAVIDDPDGPSYRLLFVAKGGGSANKTSFFQMTKALLEPDRFEAFLREKVSSLGTAACPPYRLAVVVGGTSAEENLRVLKLATTEILDGAPTDPALAGGTLFRDGHWERKLMNIARNSGLGAQFGGSAFALDARVIRLSRHAASCPVSIGVSCAAHRNLLARIDATGACLEAMEENPAALLDSLGVDIDLSGESAGATEIDLDRPMEEVRRDLSKRAVGDRVSLSGKLLVARDAAHLKWHAMLKAGKRLPDYLARYPIYYAGPAATPPGKVIGSFGPTTAQRMDEYADELMSRGASLVTLAKGNRGAALTKACAVYGGFYLGTVGGAAALIAEENILSGAVIDYPELGMEAVRLIAVKDLSAFVVVDDKGNELYGRLGSQNRAQ